MDVFAIVRVADLDLPAGARPEEILPGSKSLILTGLVIPCSVYLMESRKKTDSFYRIIAELDEISGAITSRLEAGGYPSVAVPAYFPARVRDGTICGIIPLKDCAEQAGLGRKGHNTLLIHPVFGNRVALTAVITTAPLDPTPVPGTVSACTGCMRCRTACPGGAIGEHGFDQKKCLNVSRAVPRLVRPWLGFLLGNRFLVPAAESFVNRRAMNTEVVCSECVTACPFFERGSETVQARGSGE